MLEKHLKELATENNVLCFQEVNNSWHSWMIGFLASDMKPVSGDPHVDGLCIFHDNSVTVKEVLSQKVYEENKKVSKYKEWRRVTITSLLYRETEAWAVCNLHCINGHQDPRKIPGSRADAQRFKQDFLRRCMAITTVKAKDWGCAGVLAIGDTNLASLADIEGRLGDGTRFVGTKRDFAVTTGDWIASMKEWVGRPALNAGSRIEEACGYCRIA